MPELQYTLTMKSINYIFLILIISLSSCQKDADTATQPQQQNLAGYLFSLQAFEAVDFFVLVSSMYNNSPMDTGVFNPNRVGLTIQGGEVASNYVGHLMVNDVEIPFYEGYYHKQILTNPTAFLGNVLSFALNGNSFPSFTISECSPLPTNMSFTGLDDYRIDLNGGLDVYWTPDEHCNADSTSYLVMYADDAKANSHFVSIPVLDNDGFKHIDSTYLNEFKGFETMSILYMRAFQRKHIVNGKKVGFRFIQLSNTKFVIVN